MKLFQIPTSSPSLTLEKTLTDYHQAPPQYHNWVQIDEIEWDCSKLIETIEVNAVEV